MKDGMLFGKIIELFLAATTKVCKQLLREIKLKVTNSDGHIMEYEQMAKEWSGGQIVDPKNGKCILVSSDSILPERLNVRGYFRFSLLAEPTWEKKALTWYIFSEFEIIYCASECNNRSPKAVN